MVRTDGLCAKAGIVIVAAVSVLAALVARRWDSEEGTLMNISLLLVNKIMPPIELIIDRPMEEQILFLSRITEQAEVEPESMIRMKGDGYADASFGPKATRIAELKIPSRSDPGRSVPVTCTCPHDAGPDSSLPLVLYFHAGGMILMSVKAELSFARYISSKASAIVCSVEYRLAPEHPYPAATNDALDASIALIGDGTTSPATKALSVGTIDISKVATFGMSAGGYMAAHTTRLLAQNGITVALQVSLVPMAKPNGGTRSASKFWKGPFWTGTYNAYAWSVYLPGDDGTLASDWRVSLLVDPPDETIKLLPPTYVQINSKDLLRDEGEMYSKRLQSQGKLVGLDEFNTNHVGGVPPLSNGGPGEGAYERALEVLIKHLS